MDKSISTGSHCEKEKRLLDQALDKETATTGGSEMGNGVLAVGSQSANPNVKM